MSDDGAEQKSKAQTSAKSDGAAKRQNSSGRVETILGDHAGVHISSSDEEEAQSGEIPADFGSFVVSLGTNCMIHLGHIPNPETNQTSQDLTSARHTIQLLEMLREKTDGNLLQEESRLLESLIYDLKSAYVQETRARN